MQRPHLFFAIDQPFVLTGAMATGVAVLVVPPGAGDVRAAAVRLRVRGTERPSWWEAAGGGRHMTDSRRFLEEDVFLRSKSSAKRPGVDDDVEDPNDEDDEGPCVFRAGTTTTFPVAFSVAAESPASFVDDDSSVDGKAFPWVMSKNEQGGMSLSLPKSLGHDARDRSRIVYTLQVVIDANVAGQDDDDLNEESNSNSGEFFEDNNNSSNNDVGSSSTRNNPLRSRVISPVVVQQFRSSLLGSEPVLASRSEKFFMAKGPIEVSLSIPNGAAAVSGHRLRVDVQVRNGSSKKVTELKTHFFRTLRMTAGDGVLQRRDEVFEGRVPSSEVLSGTSMNKELLIDIPAGTPASIPTGHLIKRFYEITVEAVVSMTTSNLLVTCTIPIFDEKGLLDSDRRHFSSIHQPLVAASPATSSVATATPTDALSASADALSASASASLASLASLTASASLSTSSGGKRASAAPAVDVDDDEFDDEDEDDRSD